MISAAYLSLILLVLGHWPASVDGICQNFKFVVDENVTPDHVLKGHVFKKSTVHKVTNCHVMCRDDCRCISMNYIHTKQKDTCDLNDANKEIKPVALKYRPGASYYDLVREYKYDVSPTSVFLSLSRPQGLLGVQTGGLERALASNGSRIHKLADVKARRQFETIKITNIFRDMLPAFYLTLLSPLPEI